MESPRTQALASMLREWDETTVRALEAMIKDIRDGDDSLATMEKDFDWIRHLMGRLQVLRNDVMRQKGQNR